MNASNTIPCPNCEEPMIFYASESKPNDSDPEPDIWVCPDCGYEEKR